MEKRSLTSDTDEKTIKYCTAVTQEAAGSPQPLIIPNMRSVVTSWEKTSLNKPTCKFAAHVPKESYWLHFTPFID